MVLANFVTALDAQRSAMREIIRSALTMSRAQFNIVSTRLPASYSPQNHFRNGAPLPSRKVDR
jgi:hypothetical protein